MKPTAIDIPGLAAILARRCEPGRTFVAIVGAPGSGKSTLADALAARLNTTTAAAAAVVPMDGFHYDDAVLDQLGLRPRKGAPETFDVAGLAHLLDRLKRDAEDAIAVPLFDRDLEVARAGARLVAREMRCVIVEGNYLLLTRPGWCDLHHLFDVTVLLDVPEATLRARLLARWQHYGLSPTEIAAKLDGNDLPNARIVIEESVPAHYRVCGSPRRPESPSPLWEG